MTTFGGREHDHLRDDPPLTTADMARAGNAVEDTAGVDAAAAGGNAAPDGNAGADGNAGVTGDARANGGNAPVGSPPATGSAPPAGSAPSGPGAGQTPASAGAAPSRQAASTSTSLDDERRAPLFGEDVSSQLRARWTDVQAGFVDEPRRAVEQADSLVAEAMQALASTFAGERQRLESDWEHKGDVSTEDLRQALRRYRSFFDRLLSI